MNGIFQEKQAVCTCFPLTETATLFTEADLRLWLR
nr:MAG TPA: hypothetical protein [Caudoviricetes sp.]